MDSKKRYIYVLNDDVEDGVTLEAPVVQLEAPAVQVFPLTRGSIDH